MRKLTLCFLLILSILLNAGCSTRSDRSKDEKNDSKNSDKIAAAIYEELGIDSIEYVVEEDPQNGKVRIVAQIPDYTEIFTAVFSADSDNYDKILLDIVEDEKYSTIEHSAVVDATFENEEAVFDKEAVLKEFMETELINAINAVTVQEGE